MLVRDFGGRICTYVSKVNSGKETRTGRKTCGYWTYYIGTQFQLLQDRQSVSSNRNQSRSRLMYDVKEPSGLALSNGPEQTRQHCGALNIWSQHGLRYGVKYSSPASVSWSVSLCVCVSLSLSLSISLSLYLSISLTCIISTFSSNKKESFIFIEKCVTVSSFFDYEIQNINS